ncbi:MAG: hydroxymethylglutaryl-CoA synthase [Pseudomonadota bacterium]
MKDTLSMTGIGIERLSFYVPEHYVSLETLAKRHGIDPAKFSRGIGQDQIAMPGHDEDIVTLAAEAARPVIDAVGGEDIDTILLATETGIDQSKAAGVYVHHLLGLGPNCRIVEMKHACYAATAAIQLACGHVARKPWAKVLVIATDVSRYDLDSSAEATQGCGAVAMIISGAPKVMEIDTVSGCFTEDIMDFWRPNYRKTPLVDGKYSALKYMNALANAWSDYQDNGGREFTSFSKFCYHLPFTRLGVKAHRHLCSLNESQAQESHFADGMTYNRKVGNCYTASLYLSLISTLETSDEDLSGKSIGLFSYGSGAVAEFFSGVVQPGYKDQLESNRHAALLDDRVALSYDEYVNVWHAPDPHDGGDVDIPKAARGQYRLARINEHKRIYERI